MNYSDFNNQSEPIIENNKTFVTFQPGCKVNHDIREKHGIKSNIEYRKYLTNHAEQVIQFNQDQSLQMTGTINVKPFFQSSNREFIWKDEFNKK